MNRRAHPRQRSGPWFVTARTENETTTGKIADFGCSLSGATAHDSLVKVGVPGPKRDYLLTSANVLTSRSARENIINGLTLPPTLPCRVEISHGAQG